MSEHTAQSVAIELGLNLESVGESHVRSAITAASNRVRYGSDLHRELLEAMVVPESWFFREPHAFELLQEIADKRPSGFRVLSAPCARGEEAWSAAITLAMTGRPMYSFEVVGLDVSRAALAHARKAEYQRLSLRGGAVERMGEWARASEEGVRVADDLHPVVHFREVNLTHALPWKEVQGPFDVIFCRNLMVYLTTAARRQVVESLCGLLSRNGVIIASSADSALFHGHGLNRAADFPPYVLIPAKRVPTQPLVSLPPMPVPKKIVERPVAAGTAGSSRPETSREAPMPLPRSVTSSTAHAEVARARTLADVGMHTESLAIIEGVLSCEPRLIDALELKGLVLLDSNRLIEAAEVYQHLFECQPHRPDLLMTLASIADRRGRRELSLSYRERAQAMKEREGSA